MTGLSELEKICNPILTCICNYWQYVHIGNHPAKEKFQRDIEFLLEDAKEKAAKIPALSREYLKIERSLVFFIDYMVKEGDFPFSRDWQVLARKYNELSGDEKFFNLLTDALNDPEAGDSVSLYYIMLGLGFEGIYHNDREYIEETMKRCAEKFPQALDIQTEPLVSISAEKKTLVPNQRRLTKFVRGFLIFSAVFFIISLAVNLFSFGKATADYRDVLSRVVKSAIPGSTVNTPGAPSSSGTQYP
jgi:type VI protein secretion system component VasF